MVSKRRLQELAKKARERRLDGPHNNDTEFPLIGYCFDNAFVLYHLMKEKGYQPTFMIGTTDRVADNLIQNGIDLQSDIDLIEDLGGMVHYWVEYDGYIIDIASDTHNHLGEIVITKNSDAYYTYENSVEYAEDTLHNALSRRCLYCGAQVKLCEHNYNN